MKSSKQRAKRRDRRKAKASEWKRAGRARWGSRVAHGSTGVAATGVESPRQRPRPILPVESVREPDRKPDHVRRQLGHVVLKGPGARTPDPAM